MKMITLNLPPQEFMIEGQPVPYLRMTQREVRMLKSPESSVKGSNYQKWLAIRKYFRWKEHVQMAALQAKIKFNPNPQNKVYMNVMCYFENKRHGDPDNIWKGIADALFENDKYVAGSFDYDYDKENPRCEVKIMEKGE